MSQQTDVKPPVLHAGFKIAQELDLDVRGISPYDGEPLEGNKRAYRTRTGNWQIKPHTALLYELDENGEGFCLHCGAEGQAAEPDAQRYVCVECGQPKVYGAAELALRGICF